VPTTARTTRRSGGGEVDYKEGEVKDIFEGSPPGFQEWMERWWYERCEEGVTKNEMWAYRRILAIVMVQRWAMRRKA